MSRTPIGDMSESPVQSREPKRRARRRGAPAPVIRTIRPPFADPAKAILPVDRTAAIALLTAFCLLYGAAFSLFAPYFLPFFAVPIVVLAMVAIWALPDVGRAPVKSLEALFFAFPVVLLLWPDYLAVSVPPLPWITPLRIVAFPLAALLLISISIDPAFRARLWAALKGKGQVWGLLVAFAVIQFVTVPFSRSPLMSLQKAIIDQVVWTAVFFISVFVFSQPGRARSWSYLFMLCAVPIVIIGLLEHRNGAPLWAGHVPSFLKIDDPNVAMELEGKTRLGEYRVQSTFSTPLGLGEYAALCMPFLVSFATRTKRTIVKALTVMFMGALFYVVLLSDSRVGLVGCLVGFLFYLLCWSLMRWRTRTSSLFGPAITLAYPLLFVCAVVSSLVVHRIRSKIWGTGQYDDSDQGRVDMYREGIPKVLSNPIGHGAGMGAETLGITNPDGVLTIDTYYMRIALEYGVLGFVAYFGAILFCIATGFRSWFGQRKTQAEHALLLPSTIALAVFLLEKSVFSNEDNHPLAFTLMGMIVALSSSREVENRAGAAAQTPRRQTGGTWS